jgi:archaeal preflagellin peptidase FlaK
VVSLADGVVAGQVGALLVGFAIAAVSDLRTREVSDRLWQALGAIGLVLGTIALSPGGTVPVVLWIVVAGLAFEHMVSWDLLLGPDREGYADLIELVAYVVVIAVVATAAARVGVGSSGVPYAVIACLATILFSRGLFEVGVLYGGGDAKALMIAGVLVPTFASPLLVHLGALAAVTSVLPFSIDLLLDAAILSIGIPLAIAVRNLQRGTFRGLGGFTGFEIPVSELPRRFVWIRDPAYGSVREQEGEIETSEDDRKRRVEIAKELRAKGVERVWVTPQIPFLLLMTLGAVLALLAGNLVLDLVALV